MSKVTIRTKVTIDQADYDKIMEFAEKDEQNIPLRDLDKFIETHITMNLKAILGQIAALEAQEQAAVSTKVGLFGIDGKPLTGGGN